MNPHFCFIRQNDKDKANFEKLIEALKKSKGGKSVGTFSKDKFPGEFMDAWRDAFSKAGFETVRLTKFSCWLFVFASICHYKLLIVKIVFCL